jgi:hypothetical protein
VETTKRQIIWSGEFKDAPGVWKMDIAIEGESGHWSVVRKLDGTWWYVAAMQGGIPGIPVRVELGEQITDPKAIAELEEQLAQAKKKREETLNEGDRVRIIATGTTGTIKGFGSLPGVPKIINVAYDGGGGCNHKPEELEKIKMPPLYDET